MLLANIRNYKGSSSSSIGKSENRPNQLFVKVKIALSCRAYNRGHSLGRKMSTNSNLKYTELSGLFQLSILKPYK